MSFKVPSLEEINKIEKKFTVISTFSGGGGSSIGYRMAGGQVLVANEFIPEAQKTYLKNCDGTKLLGGDIRELKGEDFLRAANLKKFELDIFDGSPPCSGFSTAGTREKGWRQQKKYSDSKQRVDDLFLEFARLVDEIKPKVFIAENVKGLVVGKARGKFKMFHSALSGCGYKVHAKVLNAQNMGVAQNRERLIFVGVRNDIVDQAGPYNPYPQETNKVVTFRECVAGLENDLSEFRPIGANTQTLKKWRLLNTASRRGQFSTVVSKTGFTRYKLSWNDRSCTINTRAEIFHPDYPRTVTINELKRLQTLPDDFVCTGTFAQQWERVARMVPPLMMCRIAGNIYEQILSKVNNV